jgi:hypothetical protein
MKADIGINEIAATFAAIRRALRATVPGLSYLQSAEILAAAFGFANYAGLNAIVAECLEAESRSSHKGYLALHISESKAAMRLTGIGFEPPPDDHLVVRTLTKATPAVMTGEDFLERATAAAAEAVSYSLAQGAVASGSFLHITADHRVGTPLTRGAPRHAQHTNRLAIDARFLPPETPPAQRGSTLLVKNLEELALITAGDFDATVRLASALTHNTGIECCFADSAAMPDSETAAISRGAKVRVALDAPDLEYPAAVWFEVHSTRHRWDGEREVVGMVDRTLNEDSMSEHQFAMVKQAFTVRNIQAVLPALVP